MPGADRLSRVALVSVAVLSATIAIVAIGESIALSSVSFLADRLRSEQKIELQPIRKIAIELGQKASLVCCRRDCLADALTVHLGYIDRLDETENYDEWAQGLERASAFTSAAIQCSPADGNLWLRLAMLRQAAVSLPEETAELMMRSAELSPAQINVILARFEVWRKMDVGGLILQEAAFRADLTRLLSYGRNRDIEATEAMFTEPLRVQAWSVVRSLPEKETDRLAGIESKLFPVEPAAP